MTLESRAAHASHSLRAAVVGVARPDGVGVIVRRRRMQRLGVVFATTVLTVLAAAIVFALPMNREDTATDTSVPTTIPITTTTLPPDEPAPAVVDPDEAEDGLVVEETTTTVGRPIPVTTEDPESITPDIRPGVVTTTQATTTTEPAEPGVFTAYQTYGRSDATPPFERFWGTGVPGDTIQAISEYGSASTTVAENGEWALTVTFPNAPSYQWFSIKVKDGHGHYRWFEFKWTGGGHESDFTANQQSGGSGTTTQDVYWGTGTPGHTVKIWSPHYAHIQKTTVINAEGKWEIAIDYGDVAPNSEFHVKADDTNTGERIYFTYTWIVDGGEPVFTAHQTYGSCDSNPPYDVFYGTGFPGDTISITSAYGSGSATVGDAGGWEVTVEFPSAPYHEWFDVVVSDGHGHSKTFQFKSLYQETPDHVFTANQQHGTSDANPPYDVFYGTGFPGDTISVTSAYGSGSTTVGDAGGWEVTVEFPTAPYHEWFDVVVSDEHGHSKTLQFKSLYQETPDHVFTANQQHGSSDATPPTDHFWGTATPGHTIKVFSAYQTNTTAVDGGGNWAITVAFPGAPIGEPFDVKVKDVDTGEIFVFSFTALEAPPEWVFTANQQESTFGGDPGTNVYSGTGIPDSTVTVASPYSSATSTTVGGDGTWAITVAFSGAPVDEAFTVTVSDGLDTATFTLKRVA
jgi:hypothetical protein